MRKLAILFCLCVLPACDMNVSIGSEIAERPLDDPELKAILANEADAIRKIFQRLDQLDNQMKKLEQNQKLEGAFPK